MKNPERVVITVIDTAFIILPLYSPAGTNRACMKLMKIKNPAGTNRIWNGKCLPERIEAAAAPYPPTPATKSMNNLKYFYPFFRNESSLSGFVRLPSPLPASCAGLAASPILGMQLLFLEEEPHA